MTGEKVREEVIERGDEEGGESEEGGEGCER